MKIRTGYSFNAAFGPVDECISRLVEIGSTVAPITDRCSTFGFVQWETAAKAAGLRPVFGVEIGCVTQIGDKRPAIDYWTFIAKDSIVPINRLIALATANPGKEPTLTYAQALAAGDVFMAAGSRVLLNSLLDAAHFSPAILLQPSMPRGLFKAAKAAGCRFIASSDNVFPRSEDREVYRVALGRNASVQTYPQYILSDSEWIESIQAMADPDTIAAALAGRDAAWTASTAGLARAEMLHPNRPASLEAMCEAGAEALGVDLTDQKYANRLAYELTMIKQKNFEDYFYIIADLVQWARSRMIVGPARGSSCGSLVCYLLGITTVDPIPYKLYFERFIDLNRADLPDIDIDFSDSKRHLVFEYAEQKYGRDRVARLGTVNLFKVRSALKQTRIALNIKPWLIEQMIDAGDDKGTLEEIFQTDTGKKLLAEYPSLTVAQRFEDEPSHASQHAAGIVITEKPIIEYCAIDRKTKGLHVDKKSAEALGLLKIDALGLTQLSVFERTLELIGVEPIGGFLEKIPLNDSAAFEILNAHRFAGIFQFNGAALQGLSRSVTITALDDLVSITALARPGPMASGAAAAWTRRKMGLEPIQTLHPMLTEITADTYGIIIYQETVMNIVRQIGCMSWEDTSKIRKAISLSMGSEQFEKYWEAFKLGAVETNGITPFVAREIWELLKTFGAYGFNKSHAVAYGIVSYWCAWFKAHHPLEFAAATLDAEAAPEKQIIILREMINEGIGYIPVDIEKSSDRWAPAEIDGKNILVGPLSQVKGIGPVAVQEILNSRFNGHQLRPSLRKRLDKAETEIDSLYPIADRVKSLHPDLSTSVNILTEPTPIVFAQCGLPGEVVLIGLLTKMNPKNENSEEAVIKRNGRKVYGPETALNMWLRDDSDEIFCKIDRLDYEVLFPRLIENAKVGKSLFAFKGTIPKGFRMLQVKNLRFLGMVE